MIKRMIGKLAIVKEPTFKLTYLCVEISGLSRADLIIAKKVFGDKAIITEDA